VSRPPNPARSRLLRRLAIGGALAALPALFLIAAWVWAGSEAARDLVLSRVLPRVESRLGPVSIGDTWSVGPRGVVLGPVELRGPGIVAGAPPLLTVQRVIVRPRWLQVLRGRVELEAVILEDPLLELGPRASRRDAVESLLRGAEARDAAGPDPAGARATSPLPKLFLEDAILGLGEGITLGPVALRVEATREPRGLLVSAELTGLEGTARGRLGRRDGGGWHVEATWQGLALDPLAAALRPGLLTGGGTWGELTLEGDRVRFEVTVADTELTWARLSNEPIGPWRVKLRGTGSQDPTTGQLRLPGLEVVLGAREKVKLELSAAVPPGGEGDFELSAVLPPTSLQELLVALPDALAPREDVGHIDGPLAATLEARGPLEDRAAWEVEAALDLQALRQQARTFGSSPLARPFLHRPLVDEEARGRQLQVGPENPFFVPLGEVPRVLIRAVLLSEDSFFFTHPGFDVPSLVRNLLTPKEGPVVRGGSTLTQQLAKNLYLSREKTLARKAREALLTIALEASLPKERLLEIYLNVIEWGPDVYGLGEAAWHYFAKDARLLTAREAVFLATIIPNPIRYHGYCSKNALTPVWEERMADLIAKLASAGDLDPVGEAMARFERLSFHHRPRDEAFFFPIDTDAMADDDGSGAVP